MSLARALLVFISRKVPNIYVHIRNELGKIYRDISVKREKRAATSVFNMKVSAAHDL
jgi:hypothetical protein